MSGPEVQNRQRRFFRFTHQSGDSGHSGDSKHSASRMALGLAVLGIVYGDIGTSPIYALQQAFTGDTPVSIDPVNVLGILSLIFWTLILIISLKYMTFVLKEDNRGEGGIFALIALLKPWRNVDRWPRLALILLGLFGASLLYGGVIITPAISVLSAVEGLKIATPLFSPYVIPITLTILVLLFAFQHKGTERVGSIFGPVMMLWFLTIGALGLISIFQTPQVLAAFNPIYAFEFFRHNGWVGILVLYAVFLVNTGGEALYADLGHFGRWPIRWVWFGFVLPMLLLNYFGQGALLLRAPLGHTHAFFELAPSWLLYPLIILATAATIIASQAAITGAFSLTRQAIQLGMLPPMYIKQTSEEVRGQIYVPMVNWGLMAAVISVVLMFRSSGALAAAYGAAVNGTMLITTVLAYRVMREVEGWKRPAALVFLTVFLTIELTYFTSNAMKIPDGGWFPIVIGVLFFTVMSTWRRGTEIHQKLEAAQTTPIETVIGEITAKSLVRVPGTAVFMTGRVENSPPILRLHMQRNKALQEQVILLTVLVEDVPRIPADQRIEIKHYEQGFIRVILHYGYMQGVNVPSDLARAKEQGLEVDLDDVTYYISSHTLIPSRKEGGMAAWRDRLFAFMARNSMHRSDYYQIPAAQTVLLGQQVRI